MFQKSIDLEQSIAGIDYYEPWKLIFVVTYDGKMLSLSSDTFKLLHEEVEKVANFYRRKVLSPADLKKSSNVLWCQHLMGRFFFMPTERRVS